MSGPHADPGDPVQQAIALVHERLEQLRAYHAPYDRVGYEIPADYSHEFDLLNDALSLLCRAVDAGDVEMQRELAPWREARRVS